MVRQIEKKLTKIVEIEEVNSYLQKDLMNYREIFREKCNL